MRKLPPRRGLAAELYVSDLGRSLRFYTELLGFRVSYERPEERFAAMSLGTARILLEELRSTEPATRDEIARGEWRPARLERPFGRGVNLEVPCADVAGLARRLAAAAVPTLVDLHEKSYRVGERSLRERQLVVADPDGYLIRPSQRPPSRPLTPAPQGAFGFQSNQGGCGSSGARLLPARPG